MITRKKTTGLTAWFIAFIMILGLLMSPVLAVTETTADIWHWDTEGHYDISWYNRNDTTFYLSTAEELAGLAWLVNRGDKLMLPGETAALREAFTAKTIYLTKDIYLNEVSYTEANSTAHQWPSIAGSVHTVNNNAVFNGIFDGQGHSIYNMYIHNLTVWTEYDARNRGLFGVTAENAIIENLYLRDGYVRAARSTGGIVGKTGYLNPSGDPNSNTGYDDSLSGHGTIIRNCHNVNTTVITTDSKGVGGIIGAAWNYAIIQNCSNSGNISSIGRFPAGGIAGENEYIIENCVNTGMISSAGNNAGGIVGSNKLFISSVENCYNTGKITGFYAGGINGYQIGIAKNCYSTGIVTGNNSGGLFGELKSSRINENLYYLDTAAKTGAGLETSGSADMKPLTAAELKSPDSADKLGGAFASDTNNINNGFPVLVWQKDTAAAAFTDVAAGAWYFKAVSYVMSEGLFDTVKIGAFGPEEPMTRAMLATALYRLEGSPAVTVSYAFTDIPADADYTSAVQWAFDNGVVQGITAAAFNPNGSITREQIATMLYRYAKYKGDDVSARGELSAFPDTGGISSYAVDALTWANGAGIINGAGGKLLPQGTATRAQVAQMLLNYSE